jgi:hypothetical protein
MFLCATSAQKDSNEATDLTASLFQNQLDEPIKVKKFEIELVSSVIRKDNKITITQPDNLLLFRLGPFDAGEAYTAEVEPGVYTLADLAIEIARALNDATPCNAWRGWSCTVDGTNKFTITFTTVSTPSLSTIAEITEARLNTRGFEPTYTFDAGANTVSLEPVYEKGGDGNVGKDVRADFANYLTVANDDANAASYRAVDIGNPNPENKTTTMVREVGLFEAGGRVEYIISPVPVFQTSTRFAPLISADDVYLTLEADVEGTVYDPNVFEDSFIKDMDMYKGVDELGNLSKHSQKNGILITPAGNLNAAKRGPPYSRDKFTLNFPPMGIDPAEEFDVRRQELYINTFGGNMIFDKTTTQKFPNRGFQIAIGETPTETALSTLNFTGYDRENLKFRLATRPLIIGLQVKNDTKITTTNILVDGATPAPGETKIEYIVGRTGTMNLRTFGLAAFASSGQGKLVKLGEPDVFKTPVYRIDAIDSDGKPTAVTLMDGGEHIFETKAADGGDLFLNDPNTFTKTTEGTLTDEDIVLNLCSKLDIGDEATQIGNLSIFENVQTAFQYLPTEVGIVNDQIYQAVEEGFDDNNGNPSFPVRYSKDVSVKITPLSRTNTAEKFVEFQVHQFQPTTAMFGEEEDIGSNQRITGGQIEVKTLVLQARPGTWNSLTYSSGTPPANWSAAFAAPDADQRIKITIEQSQIYKQIIKCSFSTDAGVSFQEEITLLESGNKVTGQVPGGEAFRKFEFTTKPRHFPLHPCISQYPSALRDIIPTNPDTLVKGIFTAYPRGASYRQGFNVVRGFKGNYEKNLIFQTEGATQPSVFAPFPTTLGNNHRPQIVLKTKQTGFTEVANGSAYPLADGSIREQEVPPIRATLGGLLGLHSAYSAEEEFTSPKNFVGATATEVIADIPTVAVEINNIPIDGYISKDYDARDAQVGVGSRLPIVGVIPSLEETTASTKPQIDFRYNAPYSQPVVCDLPTEQFLYNLSFRLREVSTGRILEGLRHPTELIFRLRNLDEKLEEEKKM